MEGWAPWVLLGQKAWAAAVGVPGLQVQYRPRGAGGGGLCAGSHLVVLKAENFGLVFSDLRERLGLIFLVSTLGLWGERPPATQDRAPAGSALQHIWMPRAQGGEYGPGESGGPLG